MSSWSSFIFFFLFSLLTSFRASAQDLEYFDHECSNKTTYSRNSTYFTNLKTLLSSLSSPNASYSTGFQNATAGKTSDRVTGLFLCRGDLSPEVCRSCVNLLVKDILNRCPNESEVWLFYDKCMLRYSNRNILSTLDTKGGQIMTAGWSVASEEIDRFKDLVLSMLNQSAIEAASNSRKFATGKANWTAYRILYGLVQCTPDITSQECSSCLQRSISRLPFENMGGILIYPSCNSRYDLYEFYNETAIITPPPPPPPPASTPPVSAPPQPVKGRSSNVLVIAIVVPIIVAVLLFIACYCFYPKSAKKTTTTAFDGDDTKTLGSLQLDYRTIQTVTDDFSESNKIGQGGFGEVYKGTFSNGTEVAVKRLSKASRQGDIEFKNEVVVVAKLQHKNLVRLLGFCLEREERILVYEFVPNKSLDNFLFDSAKQFELDWTQRYKIIGGIARGILYLHQDSRLTIIHRDLKASNILLDVNMNPKIADFGIAKIFGMDQSQDKTSRIVGTYGYMSPEYAMSGQFSMKSDVYSFGVIILEIISGRKNTSFYETNGALDLITYAWRLWCNGIAFDLVDPIIVDNCSRSQVVRCIHIGLLCVQEDPIKRPTLSRIVLMLFRNTSTLPMPLKPGFFTHSTLGNDQIDSDQSMITSSSVIGSVDDASITILEGEDIHLWRVAGGHFKKVVSSKGTWTELRSLAIKQLLHNILEQDHFGNEETFSQPHSHIPDLVCSSRYDLSYLDRMK